MGPGGTMGDKVKKAFLVAAAMMAMWAMPAAAQTPITVGSTTCGATALPYFNCFSVPVMVGDNASTAWFDPQYNGGFILFRPAGEGANYVEARVTSVQVLATAIFTPPPPYKPGPLVTQVQVNYTIANPSLTGLTADPDGEGDADQVSGYITINATYRWGCNSGRGAGCRWIMSVTGGSGSQSITVD